LDEEEGSDDAKQAQQLGRPGTPPRSDVVVRHGTSSGAGEPNAPVGLYLGADGRGVTTGTTRGVDARWPTPSSGRLDHRRPGNLRPLHAQPGRSTTGNLRAMAGPPLRTSLPRILLATAVVAAADLADAIIVWVGVFQRSTVPRILQSIAAGLLGPATYRGGTATALLGLGLH